MDYSTTWWLVAGALVIAELLTGSFYLLMLAMACAVGALCAHAGLSPMAQVLTASILGVTAVLACYLVRKRRAALHGLSSNRELNLDVGESVMVEQWSSDGTAQVRYRGAQWTVIGRPGNLPSAGMHRVAEVVGNRLLVDKI
ncbi:NfeD family protein [Comamonas composti]|uniref:NfeD family protein n=1 Tax=Comamonas composti TaxID=408558 RepID=UPI0004096BB8|nr:NfeD family protein [Comamonas composti]